MAQKPNTIDSSAIVDMEIMDGDESDYEVNLDDVKQPDTGYSKQSEEKPLDVQGEVAKGVTAAMFEAGRQQAKKVFDVYGKIDVLRPYFDVEPHEVRQRLLFSFIPQRPTEQRQKVHRELYGPVMVVFTLIAILLFQMKVADHQVQEGTLMGSAFGVCFGYWFGISSFIWVVSYVCNTHISMLQILSLLGYALTGHCVVLGLNTIVHTGHSHVFFYLSWAAISGLSTVKMLSVLASRTAGKTQKMAICGVVATIHLLFLLYLHFAYHHIVEDLSMAIDKGAVDPVIVPGEIDVPKEGQDQTLSEAKNLAEKPLKRVIEAAGDALKVPVQRVLRDTSKLATNMTNNITDSKILNVLAGKVKENIGNLSTNGTKFT